MHGKRVGDVAYDIETILDAGLVEISISHFHFTTIPCEVQEELGFG